MNILNLRLVPALIVLLAVPCASALAQAGAKSFDQYPSFIELTSAAGDGAQSVLRCGYSANGSSIALDPGFREMSVLNQARASYSRIQRIDDFLIATANAPSGGNFLLELVKPDGSVVAKSCQMDTNTDTIGNCKPIQAFTFADQIKAGDTKIGEQCSGLLQQGGSQINASLASPQKTDAFKAGLRQKVSVLAAP